MRLRALLHQYCSPVWPISVRDTADGGEHELVGRGITIKSGSQECKSSALSSPPAMAQGSVWGWGRIRCPVSVWSCTQVQIPAQTWAAGLGKEMPLARSRQGAMEGSVDKRVRGRARVGKGSQISPFSPPKEASVQEPEEYLGPRSQKKSPRS